VDRRRKAFLPNGLEQKIVDRFLPIGERWKHKSYILKIISVVNSAINKPQLLRLRSPDSLQHTPNACLRSSTIARFAAETFLTALKAIFCDDEKQLELLEGRLELERWNY
jgi:hypothetical protein